MKGLELSERFYREFGEKMLNDQFPSILPHIAIGLCGSGSECFGYDDEISSDHDFEPGFCIFIPDEDEIDRRDAFLLERAYSKLPKEYMGYKRSSLSPVGGNRHGVIKINDFFVSKTGTPDGVLTASHWLSLPEQSLNEATNGKIFFDGAGTITKIRQSLSYFPEDIRRKKIAGEVLIMGQSGQYNFTRCIKRNEYGAAQLALYEFVKSALHTVFLLNKKYMPYYKWSFRALRELPLLSELHSSLEYLISNGNEGDEAKTKAEICEDICALIFSELKNQSLSTSDSAVAEAHAHSVNNSIKDEEIRNLHILYAIK